MLYLRFPSLSGEWPSDIDREVAHVVLGGLPDGCSDRFANLKQLGWTPLTGRDWKAIIVICR